MQRWEFTAINCRKTTPTDAAEQNSLHIRAKSRPLDYGTTTLIAGDMYPPADLTPVWCIEIDGRWDQATLEEVSELYGHDGWELVTVLPIVEGGFGGGRGEILTNERTLYFKRQLEG
jgi:hypothetical protein